MIKHSCLLSFLQIGIYKNIFVQKQTFAAWQSRCSPNYVLISNTWLHVCISLESTISLTANYFCITLNDAYCRLSTLLGKRIKVTTDRTFNWYTDSPILPKKMEYFHDEVLTWATYEHVEIYHVIHWTASGATRILGAREGSRWQLYWIETFRVKLSLHLLHVTNRSTRWGLNLQLL